ncbi:hypothetical protein GCM10010381_53770 [Streptomyces xantholiticus]|nr:hypothetical protein GCM10010381_53770 [Streptomyces xantholiticus]
MKTACCHRDGEQQQAKTYPSGDRSGPGKEGESSHPVCSRNSYADPEERNRRAPSSHGDGGRRAEAQGLAHPCRMQHANPSVR